MPKNKLKILLSCLTVSWIALPSLADNCHDCHSEWEEGADAPTALIKLDIHFKAGLGCADCHGGNPELDDMDDVRDSEGYKGIPEPQQIPKFCASCHSNPAYMIKYNPSLPTDQFDKYGTSIHGERLLRKGDTRAANCVSCHSVHDIESPQIPASTVYALNLPRTCAKCHADPEYMADYGISTNQFNDFVRSVHGNALLVKRDLGAPACNDCHGNHGATPPGVTSISAVCGLCHSLIADEFAKSPHKEAFDSRGYPECEGCHSNHYVEKPSINWVGLSDSSLCITCHSDDDGTTGLSTAEKIHAELAKLYKVYEKAEAETDEADFKGMLVTDLRFALREVHQAIIKTRTAVHTFNADEVLKAAQPGVQKSEQVYQSAIAKIDEYYFRRKGLGVATLIITILVVALYFRIRSTGKRD